MTRGDAYKIALILCDRCESFTPFVKHISADEFECRFIIDGTMYNVKETHEKVSEKEKTSHLHQ